MNRQPCQWHQAIISSLLLLLIFDVVQADICFLWYLNADNFLESSVRQNLQDYMQSPAIRASTVQSWVYFDALNLPANEEEALAQKYSSIVTAPLENVWADETKQLKDVSPSKHEGSLYMTYKHDMEKMMVEKTIEKEVDSDDPATLWGFVGYSMQRCLQKNATDVMLILTGYGGGSAGLGGDIHPHRERYLMEDESDRELQQEKQPPPKFMQDFKVEENEDIAFALRTVLADLGSQAPSKYSVIGLEGKYMSNFHVVNDFMKITDHVLASESMIPQHGWSYSSLSEVSSAKALAQQIAQEYIAQPRSESGEHSTPKTIALIDTSEKTSVFDEFQKAFNELLGNMTQLLNDLHDIKFFVSLHRARSQAVTYAKETAEKAAVDLGSFLTGIQTICNPESKSDLAVSLQGTIDAYNKIFVDREFGSGTEVGTGMLFDLPLLREYNQNPQYWQDLLVKDGGGTTLKTGVPNYAAFFQAYVTGKTSELEEKSVGRAPSVCKTKGVVAEGRSSSLGSSTPNGETVRIMDGQETADEVGQGTGTAPLMDRSNSDNYVLFVNPQIVSLVDDEVVVKTDLEKEVASVEGLYGINVTSLLDKAKSEHGVPAKRRRLRRQLQTPLTYAMEDFLLLYGGTATGEFVGSETEDAMDYTAKWERKFHVIHAVGGQGMGGVSAADRATSTTATSGNNSASMASNTANSNSRFSDYHPIFVEEPEESSGARTIKVVFFPPYNNLIRDERAIPIGTSVEAAKTSFGGDEGYLEFQTNPETGEETFSLYVNKCTMKLFGLQCMLVGQAREMGGFFAPVIPVRGMVWGNVIRELVGGYTGHVLEWSDEAELRVESLSDVEYQSMLGAGSVVLELHAKAADESRYDVHTFNIVEGQDTPSRGVEPLAPASPPPTPEPIPTDMDGVDVAKCKPAIQSSTMDGNIAKRALSGDLSTISHTDCENKPWWMVDLFFPRQISSVLVVNRPDCCQERLDGLVIELLDPNDVTVAFVQHDPSKDGPFGNSWTATFDNLSARKVRLSVQRPEGECEFLNLAEVQVYSDQCTSKDSCQGGTGCDYGNIALCKPADQSSTLFPPEDPTGVEARASNAVDSTLLLSHTECEKQPWWQVDLLSERAVTEIVIKNREDCCFERLDGLKVELFDDHENLKGYYTHDPRMGHIQPMIIVHFDSVMTRKVKVSVEHPDMDCAYLNLEEVQVYGTCQDGDTCKTQSECIHDSSA